MKKGSHYATVTGTFFSQRKNKDREKQLEYIYENSIKYNDKYVNKIFYENEKFRQFLQSFSEFFVQF